MGLDVAAGTAYLGRFKRRLVGDMVSLERLMEDSEPEPEPAWDGEVYAELSEA